MFSKKVRKLIYRRVTFEDEQMWFAHLEGYEDE